MNKAPIENGKYMVKCIFCNNHGALQKYKNTDSISPKIVTDVTFFPLHRIILSPIFANLSSNSANLSLKFAVVSCFFVTVLVLFFQY